MRLEKKLNACRKSTSKPPRVFCKNEFLSEGLIERTAYSRGRGSFQSFAFPSKADLKNEIIFSKQKIAKRLFCKRKLVINSDFFIIIAKVAFHFASFPVRGFTVYENY